MEHRSSIAHGQNRLTQKMRSASSSVCSSSLDTSGVDMDDLDMMNCLVHDVRSFSESMGRLAALLDERMAGQTHLDDRDGQSYCVRVHDSVTDVSRLFKDLLRYQFLRTADLLTPAATLVHSVKELKFGDDSEANERAHDAAADSIKRIETALAERLRTYMVGDYLSWEMTQDEQEAAFTQSAEDLSVSVSARSAEMNGSEKASCRQRLTLTRDRRQSACDLTAPTSESRRSVLERDKRLSVTAMAPATDQLDKVLLRHEDGIELAFNRSKLWSKYCKELLNFVQRRINLETEHARQILKLAECSRILVSDGDFLPMQNIFLSSFRIESDFATNCAESMQRLYEVKFIKRIERCKNEHDRRRKQLRDTWDRQLKSFVSCNHLPQDAVGEVRKAKAAYSNREQQYKKARDTSLQLEVKAVPSGDNRTKIEKKRRTEEDAMLKCETAAENYKILTHRVQEKKREVDECKTQIVSELRELVYQCDQTLKAASVSYFQTMSGLWALVPMQFQALSDSTREYVPGTEYNDWLSCMQRTNITNHRRHRDSSEELSERVGKWVAGRPANSNKSSVWTDQDDSTDYYPTVNMLGGDTSVDLASSSSSAAALSSAAKSHTLQSVRLPARCSHCDTYTFFKTVTCQECGMSWHRACLQNVDVQCGPGAKSLASVPRRMSIFGVPLRDSMVGEPSEQQAVPVILRKCIEQLERRGARTKGIYRVCGVKSKIEQLCEQFECSAPDLSNESATNISSVVKLYLRQLPEPLCTADLYGDFVQFAKSYPPSQEQSFATDSEKDFFKKTVVAQCQHLIKQMPYANAETLKFLLLHLRRLTWFEADTGMSASNFGIVFGPTLLWRDAGDTPLDSLLDAPMQARCVELMIRFVYDIFNVDSSEDRDSFISEHGSEYQISVPTCHAPTPSQVLTDDSGVPDAEHDTTSSGSSGLLQRRAHTLRQSATPDLLKTHQEPKKSSHIEGGDNASVDRMFVDTSSNASSELAVSPKTFSAKNTVRRQQSSPAGAGRLTLTPTSGGTDRPKRTVRRTSSQKTAAVYNKQVNTTQQRTHAYTTSILISPFTARRHVISSGQSPPDSDQEQVQVTATRGQLVLPPNRPSATRTTQRTPALLFSSDPEDHSLI